MNVQLALNDLKPKSSSFLRFIDLSLPFPSRPRCFLIGNLQHSRVLGESGSGALGRALGRGAIFEGPAYTRCHTPFSPRSTRAQECEYPLLARAPLFVRLHDCSHRAYMDAEDTLCGGIRAAAGGGAACSSVGAGSSVVGRALPCRRPAHGGRLHDIGFGLHGRHGAFPAVLPGRERKREGGRDRDRTRTRKIPMREDAGASSGNRLPIDRRFAGSPPSVPAIGFSITERPFHRMARMEHENPRADDPLRSNCECAQVVSASVAPIS